MGVGGCAVASLEMQRKFIGGDMMKDVYDTAVQRVFEASKLMINTGYYKYLLIIRILCYSEH